MIESVTMYRLICDWPGCEESAQEGGDYYAWSDAGAAVDEASGAGWREGCDGSWFCEAHPADWSSEHENGEPWPEPPYLRIHDGDDDYQEHDDGSVCLIGAAE